MTKTNAVNDIRHESSPEEVAVDRRYRLLAAEVTECLVDVVDKDVANPVEATAWTDRYPDVGYAETKATVGAILVEKAG